MLFENFHNLDAIRFFPELSQKKRLFWMDYEVLDRFGVRGLYELYCPPNPKSGRTSKAPKLTFLPDFSAADDKYVTILLG